MRLRMFKLHLMGEFHLNVNVIFVTIDLMTEERKNARLGDRL